MENMVTMHHKFKKKVFYIYFWAGSENVFGGLSTILNIFSPLPASLYLKQFPMLLCVTVIKFCALLLLLI